MAYRNSIKDEQINRHPKIFLFAIQESSIKTQNNHY